MNLILDALRRDPSADQRVFCHFLQAGRVVEITEGELRQQAERFAHFLQAHGTKRGDVVIIILRHSPELLYSFLGAMLVGAIPSFMPYPTSRQDPRHYWDSHEQLFARVGDGTLLTDREHLAAIGKHLPNLALRVLAVSDAPPGNPPFTAVAVAPHDIALLQHSSGTTGLKKGVALSHAAVLRQVAEYSRRLQLNPSDRIVSWLPLYHDMGLIACFLLPLLARVPVVMLDPFEWVVNPKLLFNAVQQYRGTLCWMPNFAFHHLCRGVRSSPDLDLSSMRAWINCSEPCRTETFDQFADTFADAGVRSTQLQVCYAMAETVFAVTQTRLGARPRVLTVDSETMREQGRVKIVEPDAAGQSVLSTGTPIDGLNIRIVSDQGSDLGDDNIGEIVISGESLFSGYFKLELKTERKLRDGYYFTGDLGFWHEGELYVTGRKHDLIIVHGRNYYAHELEFIINRLPSVHPGRNIAAGWFRPEVGSEEVVIVAETAVPSDAARAELVGQIKQVLLDQTGLLVYDVYLVGPGWLVKTTSGKLSRIENLNKYVTEVAAAAAV